MRCNVTDCYWNLWSPTSRLFNDEESKQCVSENLDEHYDEQSSFKMTPNMRSCQGFLSHKKFIGGSK